MADEPIPDEAQHLLRDRVARLHVPVTRDNGEILEPVRPITRQPVPVDVGGHKLVKYPQDKYRSSSCRVSTRRNFQLNLGVP
jgi:hypothetical protein